MPNYYEISEFAGLKNCSRQTVYNAIKRGELETSRMYGKLLLKKSVKNQNWQSQESKKR